jgi:ATP-binding cassette subfamily F protein uup
LSESTKSAGAKPAKPARPQEESPVTANRNAPGKRRKLSHKLQRELESLPGQIEALEQEQIKLQEKMSAPGFYQSADAEVQRVMRAFARIQTQLDASFERWNTLEAGA